VAARLGLEIVFDGEDASENPAAFDADDYIERVVRTYPPDTLAGVFASDDYPAALVAAVLAGKSGLPGPTLEAVLNCSDKYRARMLAARAVPEATPEFRLIDASAASIATDPGPFPRFAKPSKGFLSMFADRVEDAVGLARLCHEAEPYLSGFLRPFRYFSNRCFGIAPPGTPFLVEELVTGRQVTVEGYFYRGQGRIIGTTDSVMYPGTNSFSRFVLPSNLPATIQARMEQVALRLAAATGFDNGVFNVELMYDPDTDRISAIEINPRMCPQFADLVEKVHGVSTYEIALRIAAGADPGFIPGRGQHQAAASFVLRRFEDALVMAVPSPGEVEQLRQRFPDVRVRVLCRPGRRLSDEQQDRASFRYGLVNLGAGSTEQLHAAFSQATAGLTFDLMAL
jgi:biotin carboxylase